MTSTAVQAKPIAPLQVVELQREPPRYVPEKIYLKAFDPALPDAPLQRLMVQLEDHNDESEILVDLLTNNDSFLFLTQVIRQHFRSFVCIYENWMPEDKF